MYCCWVLQVSSLNANSETPGRLIHRRTSASVRVVTAGRCSKSAELGETISNATHCKTSCGQTETVQSNGHSSMADRRDSMSKADHKLSQGY